MYTVQQEDNAYGQKFNAEMMLPVFFSDVFTALVCNRCTNTVTNKEVYGAHASLMVSVGSRNTRIEKIQQITQILFMVVLFQKRFLFWTSSSSNKIE